MQIAPNWHKFHFRFFHLAKARSSQSRTPPCPCPELCCVLRRPASRRRIFTSRATSATSATSWRRRRPRRSSTLDSSRRRRRCRRCRRRSRCWTFRGMTPTATTSSKAGTRHRVTSENSGQPGSIRTPRALRRTSRRSRSRLRGRRLRRQRPQLETCTKLNRTWT